MVRTVARARHDLFGWPVVGFVLKNRWFLLGLRLVLLALFAYAIIFGLIYPDKNDNLFTTGLFWGIFWPFFIVVTLPTLGAVFCGICPHGFIGKHLTRIGLNRQIPLWLQKRGIGLGVLLVGYWIAFYAYEPIFKGPLATALFFLILTVVAVGMFFLYENMAYCKYVCPIGSVKGAFSKVGFTWLSTEKSACDGCKSFECTQACPYHLNPVNFDKHGSMGDCTLCMECAQACEAVTFKARVPSSSLMKPIKKMREIDIWVYLLLFGVISLTMRFHHALGRSAVADQLPWYAQANMLEAAFPWIGLPLGGLMAMLYGVGLTLLFGLGGIYLASKVLKKPYPEMFTHLGYALAPLMIVGAISHAGSFFFTHYYHHFTNGFIQAFALPYGFVEPLANRRESWLGVFKIFNYAAAFWSFWLFYKRINLLEVTKRQKIAAYPLASALVIFYLATDFFVGWIFATYGVGGHHHG